MATCRVWLSICLFYKASLPIWDFLALRDWLEYMDCLGL